MRIPKLRGFKNRFKIQYEVVNVGAIEAAVERGAFELRTAPKAKGKAAKADAQITINQDLLRAAGLVKSLNKPLKVLGNGELTPRCSSSPTRSPRPPATKIEAAGGTVSVLEVPSTPLKAIGVEPDAPTEAAPSRGQGRRPRRRRRAPQAERPSEPEPTTAPRAEPTRPTAEAEPADSTESDEAATTSGDDA